ncbi:MAG: hypothetical protein IJ527_02135 [Prevotella sp.]|nr:hypothetical protein [Prevotella sp.]
MGGRGSFDKATMSIPVEKRKYKTLDVVDGIKIIEDFESSNGKTPVMSNTANTIYAVWSGTAGRIKHIFYYKNHVLYYSIDLEGKNSHAHNVYVDPKTGKIGRKTHSNGNHLELSTKEWNLVKKLEKWTKK